MYSFYLILVFVNYLLLDYISYYYLFLLFFINYLLSNSFIYFTSNNLSKRFKLSLAYFSMSDLSLYGIEIVNPST